MFGREWRQSDSVWGLETGVIWVSFAVATIGKEDAPRLQTPPPTSRGFSVLRCGPRTLGGGGGFRVEVRFKVTFSHIGTVNAMELRYIF